MSRQYVIISMHAVHFITFVRDRQFNKNRDFNWIHGVFVTMSAIKVFSARVKLKWKKKQHNLFSIYILLPTGHLLAYYAREFTQKLCLAFS